MDQGSFPHARSRGGGTREDDSGCRSPGVGFERSEVVCISGDDSPRAASERRGAEQVKEADEELPWKSNCLPGPGGVQQSPVS